MLVNSNSKAMSASMRASGCAGQVCERRRRSPDVHGYALQIELGGMVTSGWCRGWQEAPRNSKISSVFGGRATPC